METFSRKKILEKSSGGLIFNFIPIPYCDNVDILYKEEKLIQAIKPAIEIFNSWQMEDFTLNMLDDLSKTFIKSYQFSIWIQSNESNPNLMQLHSMLNWLFIKIGKDEQQKCFNKYPQLKEFYHERYLETE